MRTYCSVAISLIASLWLSGCDESSQIRAAKAAVKDALIDPQSAQFSDISESDTGAVCGMVNSKNSLGGYVGKRPWVMVDEHTEVLGTYEEIAELARFRPGDFIANDELGRRWNSANRQCAAARVWNALCGKDQGVVLTPYLQACSQVPGIS